jgi:hypothetical protein
MTYEDANVDHFILDERGWCCKDKRDNIFSKDGAQHEPCKTMDVKVMLLVLLVFRGYKISRMKFL